MDGVETLITMAPAPALFPSQNEAILDCYGLDHFELNSDYKKHIFSSIKFVLDLN